MNRKTALTSLAALACAPAAAVSPASAAATDIPLERVKAIVRARERIVSPSGIDELIAIPVNGERQWLSIRGQDKRNPVLLFLHGGPGSPTMPEAWTFQTPWEDFFTVVQWDQRGAGKTYASNDSAQADATISAPQMERDAGEVVRYLLRRLAKRKIFVLGHSWGSYLGLHLAMTQPGLLHAYIGTGQIIDMLASEAEGYAFALDQARAHGNTQAVRELESIAPYPGTAGLTIDRIGTQRTWLSYYGGLAYGRTDFQWDADAWRLSPLYTQRDVAEIDRGGLASLHGLLPALARANFKDQTTFACPIFLFMGRHDYTTSYEIAHAWYKRVQAPRKAFVTFENSAHMVMQEEPGRYLQHLVTLARPIAVSAGDAAPAEKIE